MTDSEDRLRLLYELGSAFAAHLELDGLLALVVRHCTSALDAEGASVLLLDPTGSVLFFPYAASAQPGVAERLANLRIPAERGIAGAALQAGHAICIPDVTQEPRFNPAIDRETGFTTRALLCVPLRGRRGAIGVLQVVNPRRPGSFTDADVGFVEALAGSAGIAIENARLYEEVRSSEGRLREQIGALRRDLARLDGAREIVGATPAMHDVFRLMESAAASPIPVLVEGETGTGKELVARGIHRMGPRADAPFIAVNCAALAETLLESELFGHRRGAFTGAVQDRQGVFEAAHAGTLLLDEIGEMPTRMQAKLLRVLQEGEIVPVGDHRPRRVDVRVVAATNRALADEAQAGRFRSDLYYRLAAFPILVPPLRARRDDVPLLVDHFLRSAAERHAKPMPRIDPAALALLVRFDWPGNVRELRNELERAVALTAPGTTLGADVLSAKLTGSAAAPPTAVPIDADDLRPLREARAAFEIRHVGLALRRHGGNVSRAARALGISRVAMQKKMRRLGLRP